MKMKEKILVAMSGGVDSSVAAYLLKEEGYDVIGATMKLFCYAEKGNSPKSCCSLESINDAKVVCENLGIPHYVIGYEKEFEKEVIGNFVSEYERGRTPNPCIRCNQFIKFGYLLKKAKELGCEYLATGHYARISPSCHSEPFSVIPVIDSEVSLIAQTRRAQAGIHSAGKLHEMESKNPFRLLKGVDTSKDQTYFLYRLNKGQLANLKFPLGDMTKKEARGIAKKAGLKIAEKAESQEVCFIDTNVPDFLQGKIEVKKGDILDKNGNRVGEHEGVPFYTIGQRKGLGGGFKNPMYVTGIDVVKNTVTVGEEADLYKNELIFDEVSWIFGEMPEDKQLTAIIRYNMKEKKVDSLEKLNEEYKVIFKDKVRAVTPGQSIVFYSGDECLGGGIIVK